MQSTTKVILLGIDGLDPNILEELMSAGKLPAFDSIRNAGTFRSLETSNPPQSPVAWSTIATGSNPGHHGIFDFITRTPDNYLPVHSIVKVNPRNILKSRASSFLPVRKGTSFWDITSRSRVPTKVIRWPVTFPPEKLHGHMLSGMGVLDLQNNIGRYAFYTTEPTRNDIDCKGDIINVAPSAGFIRTAIQGPEHSEVPMDIVIDEQHNAVNVNIAGFECMLGVRELSDWIQVRFKTSPFKHITGSCRLFLDTIKPELRLYVSPIQIEPAKPVYPISYPDKYAVELADAIGCFNTLGIPEDTNALSDGCIDDDTFLDLCDRIMSEREKMLWHELNDLKEGLLAFVFDTTDRIQHIYWRTRDPEHPGYDEEYMKRRGDVIEDYYIHMDRILERVLESVDKRTILCVLSDHGFTSFRRAVHLNSWLVQNRLMALRRPASDEEGDPLFKNVIWEKTRAYAVGFSSIYLNMYGRESKGIVRPGDEAERLKMEIAGIVKSLKDPKTGRHVVSNVYTKEELYSGPFISEAPDLVVGFEPGYRASWQTAIGGVPPKILDDNIKKWSGDHIVDAQHVPGIFLMNKPINVQRPRVVDVAPTILSCFQIDTPDEMEGTSLLE